MSNLYYYDQFVNALTKYSEIIDKIDKLTSEKEKIRNQIKEWLRINELEEYKGLDLNEQLWKIETQKRKSKSINDWNILYKLLEENNSIHLVQEKESDSFVIKRVKK